MKLIKKYIYFLLIISTLFFFKTNVYAEDPTNYCYFTFNRQGSSSSLYAGSNNFCTGTSKFSTNDNFSFYNFFDIYGVSFKVSYTPNNYLNNYALLYNYDINIYQLIYFNSDSTPHALYGGPSINNNERIIFSNNPFNQPDDNNNYYASFDNSIQNIYTSWRINPDNLTGNVNLCVLNSNVENITYKTSTSSTINLTACTSEQLPPSFQPEPEPEPEPSAIETSINNIDSSITNYLSNIYSSLNDSIYLKILIGSLIITFFILLIRKMFR